MLQRSLSFSAKDRQMRDDEAFSHAVLFRERVGWWRLAPVVTALVVLLGTLALGAMFGVPTGDMRANREQIDVGGTSHR
jgi:hypothetical protein